MYLLSWEWAVIKNSKWHFFLSIETESTGVVKTNEDLETGDSLNGSVYVQCIIMYVILNTKNAMCIHMHLYYMYILEH